ncbi:MAG: CxxC-x17-CxxC domain-containing protein [Candidatus Heimdallarchaeaceae archaeon]
MYKTTCSACKKEATVPFKPTGVKPVYCQDCFRKIRPNDRPGDKFGRKPKDKFRDKPNDFSGSRPSRFRDKPDGRFRRRTDDRSGDKSGP